LVDGRTWMPLAGVLIRGVAELHSVSIESLLSPYVPEERGLGQGEEHDLFAGCGADVVMQGATAHVFPFEAVDPFADGRLDLALCPR
jgi:hypothetical protein